MNTVLTNFSRPLLITKAHKISIRFLRSFEIQKKDPGIRKRAAILQQNLQIEDDLEELESDFFDLSKSHKQHEREMDAARELQKYHIVEQKYFKEKTPNFLTWADKQQIKHLHQTNPEEWTIDKLSEGFPALPETIKKIIKNDWVPKNANRVKNHDKAVQQNWQQFKTQKQVMKLLPEVVNHLNKFTSRQLNLNPDLTDLEVEDVTKRKLVKEGGEFSKIIQSYEVLTKQSVNKLATLKPSTNNCKQIESGKDYKQTNQSKLLTYEELQKVMPNKNIDHGLVKDNITNDEQENKEIVLKPEELNITKFQSADNKVNLYKPKREYLNLMYPQRIKIPADKRKHGYTYKLNDCFYDSDGEFLYRVPGLL